MRASFVAAHVFLNHSIDLELQLPAPPEPRGPANEASKFAASLPAAAVRQQVLSLLEQHQVILISGETGCGKTTQVPQFLLDDAAAKSAGSCSQEDQTKRWRL